MPPTPGDCRCHRLRCGNAVGSELPLQLLLEPGLGVQRYAARLAIAHDRAAHAPRNRARQARRRQAQCRLDLAGKFVAQVQEPAADEGRARLAGGSGALGVPARVQRIEEPRVACGRCRAVDASIGVLQQHRSRQREQQVVAAEVGLAADAFEQHGVTVRLELVEPQQHVRVAGVAPRRHCSARNTRLPLVPPKPNELDSAIPSGVRRALFGT